MENSIEFPKWLEEHNILHIVTRSHANTAERAIRTFKDLLTRRIESKEIEPGEVWYNDNILYAILLKYNLRMVNRTIGLTPNEATISTKMRPTLGQCLNSMRFENGNIPR